jgi:hypothetical protein
MAGVIAGADRRACTSTAGVDGTPAHRPEDLVFTLPRIAASAAAALVSLALVPAFFAGLQVSADQSAQTHVRAT